MEIKNNSAQRSEALAKLRREYLHKGLDESELDADPFVQFRHWLDEAIAAPFLEPTAMTLATATKDGKPSARVVLLKKVDDRGFVFFTNYESRKGEELSENPNASLLFYWDALERQVRIEGTIERVSKEESKAYFDERPFASRIAATISQQSRVVRSREELEKKFDELAMRYKGEIVPLPSFWGGFRVLPGLFEFWQGRENRLHDRFRYSRGAHGWRIERLSP
ncbi:MAG: pyridoxamine 5'-phosphate oxidase [Ignavibacteriae bacterium]|nr:pyridoxamine 5'-phosphate oxidase [Ignavibacteriota bacterium]